MTIGRDHFDGPIHFCCDHCGEVTETHCTRFEGAWAKAKARGWRARRGADGEWEHRCPDCAGEELRHAA